MLDEVHERQLDSDLVFGMVREVAELRDDLTVVAMSADGELSRGETVSAGSSSSAAKSSPGTNGPNVAHR